MHARADQIYKLLLKHYPKHSIVLRFSNPLELLIATMLSAQCTDKTVNQVTEKLFLKYKKIGDYLNVSQESFEQDIRRTGFYHNKAKNILGAVRIIHEKHNDRVPGSMEELVSLPGVARKTANVVLSNAFGRIDGIVVDTHVMRLSFRLGLTDKRDAGKIEQDLMSIFPKNRWKNISNLLISHGRAVCNAKKPLCSVCFLSRICPRNGVTVSD